MEYPLFDDFLHVSFPRTYCFDLLLASHHTVYRGIWPACHVEKRKKNCLPRDSTGPKQNLTPVTVSHPQQRFLQIATISGFSSFPIRYAPRTALNLIRCSTRLTPL